ncbi:porin [Edwardsiella piscicida]|uniref:porin n=1 Tax=Edwardsiella piscicida TaxID=1263550 RepID=UPI000D507C0B|nr:porin [Edwardsiella piscicida]UCQ22541.1 porin [Edwardsiella piscicida]
MKRQQKLNTAQSVALIAGIVGEKLDLAGEETRRLAITGALPGVARAFYSRESGGVASGTGEQAWHTATQGDSTFSR